MSHMCLETCQVHIEVIYKGNIHAGFYRLGAKKNFNTKCKRSQ